MKCKEFLGKLDEFFLDVRSSDDVFRKNMKKLKEDEMSFCEWLMVWLAWHELSELDDCKRQYWQDGYD